MVSTCILFFFFKQKTAYEMRISDWSSDVCSSDLDRSLRGDRRADGQGRCLRHPGRRRGVRQQAFRELFGRHGLAAVRDRAPAAAVRNRAARQLDRGAGRMSEEILVNVTPRETRVAVVENEIGRASCRERVGQYVSSSGVAGSLKKKKK